MKKTLNLLHSLVGFVILIMFVLMVLAILWQVFGRFVLDQSPVWSEEFARYTLVWITLLGGAYLAKSKSGHISVDIFVSLLPGRVQFAMSKIRDAIIIVMAGALTYYGVLHASVGQRRISTGLNVSMDIPYYAIPVGGALIFVFVLFRFFGHGADDK